MKYFFFFLLLGLIYSCSNTKESEMNTSIATDPFSLHPSDYQADFVAYGKNNEWKLSIIFEKQIMFTKKDGSIIFRSNAAKPSVAAGADILNFHIESKKEELKVDIDVAKCNENGNLTAVHYNSKKSDVSFSEESCGNYTGDYRLSSLWNLKTINGDSIDDSIFRRQPPFFDINIRESKVSGNGGCNTFGAQMRFVYNAFYMDYITATRMYCDESSGIEEKIFDILRDEKVFYSFEENLLTLETKKGTLTFTKLN